MTKTARKSVDLKRVDLINLSFPDYTCRYSLGVLDQKGTDPVSATRKGQEILDCHKLHDRSRLRCDHGTRYVAVWMHTSQYTQNDALAYGNKKLTGLSYPIINECAWLFACREEHLETLVGYLVEHNNAFKRMPNIIADARGDVREDLSRIIREKFVDNKLVPDFIWKPAKGESLQHFWSREKMHFGAKTKYD